jgi:hypothetical protein
MLDPGTFLRCDLPIRAIWESVFCALLCALKTVYRALVLVTVDGAAAEFNRADSQDNTNANGLPEKK